MKLASQEKAKFVSILTANQTTSTKRKTSETRERREAYQKAKNRVDDSRQLYKNALKMAGIGVEGDNFVFEPVAALEKIHKPPQEESKQTCEKDNLLKKIEKDIERLRTILPLDEFDKLKDFVEKGGMESDSIHALDDYGPIPIDEDESADEIKEFHKKQNALCFPFCELACE